MGKGEYASVSFSQNLFNSLVNSLPNDNTLGLSKSKAFADDKIKVTEILKFDL